MGKLLSSSKRIIAVWIALLFGAVVGLSSSTPFTSRNLADCAHLTSIQAETSAIPPPRVTTTCRRTFVNLLSTSSATCVLGALGSAPSPALAAYIDVNDTPPTITQRVYLDVQVDEKEPQRIVIGLFGELLPRVVDNFFKLCDQNSYAGTTFYRVLSDFSIQGGAIGDPSGKSGQAYAGDPFEPDNFNIKHTKTGLVSMVRTPTGAVDSRFFINCNENGGWADDRYAAFGIVENGLNVVKAIERVPVKTPKNAPTQEVKIVASGVLTR